MQTGDKRGAIEHKLTELWHRRATGCIYGGMDAGHRQYYRSQLLELTGIWERFRREIELSKRHGIITQLVVARGARSLKIIRRDGPHGQSLPTYEPWGVDAGVPLLEPRGVDAGGPLPETKRSFPRRPAWRP